MHVHIQKKKIAKAENINFSKKIQIVEQQKNVFSGKN